MDNTIILIINTVLLLISILKHLRSSLRNLIVLKAGVTTTTLIEDNEYVVLVGLDTLLEYGGDGRQIFRPPEPRKTKESRQPLQETVMLDPIGCLLYPVLVLLGELLDHIIKAIRDFALEYRLEAILGDFIIGDNTVLPEKLVADLDYWRSRFNLRRILLCIATGIVPLLGAETLPLPLLVLLIPVCVMPSYTLPMLLADNLQRSFDRQMRSAAQEATHT